MLLSITTGFRVDVIFKIRNKRDRLSTSNKMLSSALMTMTYHQLSQQARNDEVDSDCRYYNDFS